MIKVIFTLFNLQGTALRQSLARWLIYLSTSTSICQELFSRFFEEFSRFTFKPNSSIFSVFLSKLHQFLSLFVCRSLERLDILPHQSPFVNTFFQVFSRKFLRGQPGAFLIQNRAETLIFGSKLMGLLLSFSVDVCRCFCDVDGDGFLGLSPCFLAPRLPYLPMQMATLRQVFQFTMVVCRMAQ